MSDFSDSSKKSIMKSLNRMAVDPDIQKINHIQYKVEWISSLFIYVLMNGPPNITKKTIQLKTKCNNRKIHSVTSGLFLKFSVITPKKENKILEKFLHHFTPRDLFSYCSVCIYLIYIGSFFNWIKIICFSWFGIS